MDNRRENLKTTTNSRIYKLLYRDYLDKKAGLCSYCGPHRGCNANWRVKDNRNWKKYRKTQYK